MRLTPGTRLGPKEITAPLGAVGMGEVYKARDTRLGRDVAIKELADGFANDSWPRSAIRTSPAIHGLEEHSGARYLVLKYVRSPSESGAAR
jgi:serine/threonine protein kinase